jgi:hypothetical protein
MWLSAISVTFAEDSAHYRESSDRPNRQANQQNAITGNQVIL